MLKITFSHNFLWINFRRNFTFLLGFCLSLFIFNFNTAAVFALYTPTLSASVDNAAASVNGNQVINSAHKTTEIPLSLTVNTNNKTGYTATLNSETDETALVNNDSATNAKINSISNDLSLNNLPNNTWGYKFGASTNYAPIPALSTPAQILQTTGKTNGNDTNGIKIGLKLGDNLESGRYTNKLIFSILTNNYNRIAIMTEGPDFNTKLKSLETATNKIEHFKKSTVVPVASIDAVNVEDEDSDYEIKLWLDSTDKTAYYYTEAEKVYLNADSSRMFHVFGHKGHYETDILSLNLSNFDTSKVTDMHDMFFNMVHLTTLNLSNFDTSQVTNMSSMFYGMHILTSLNLSNFDTSKVTDMNNMFSDMASLTTLDLSNFDTSKVTTMRYMFSNMSNLTTLNLSNFNTSKVTDMSGMFSNAANLTTLDLSSFDTSQVTDMSFIFATNTSQYAPPDDKLEKIYVNNDFNTANLTDTYKMFQNRKKLRGGNGSYLADPSTADKTWLRIDDPAHGRPGYFTRKP